MKAASQRAAPGREMHFRDPGTGDYLRSHDEEAAGRLAAETRVAAAETRAAAEAEDRATEAAARLAAEKRAAAAEARVAALEALFRERSP